MALLWKMICNLGDPMSLRHPVVCTLETLSSQMRDILITNDLWGVTISRLLKIKGLFCKRAL